MLVKSYQHITFENNKLHMKFSLRGTIDFSSELTIPPNFTAERAENAETLEKTSGVWNTLKLCALCDLRVDKSLVFSIVPAIYQTSDNFFRFRFRFVYPNRSDVEGGNVDGALTKIGNWWGHFREDGVRKEIEIDIVTLNEDTMDILFAECKWQNKKVGINTYNKLREKSKLVEWHNDKRREYFALFSKVGFAPELKKRTLDFC